MPTSKEYYEFISDQLSHLSEVSYRKMMGEYILYFGGKVVGGIYDDRLLVKPTESALALVPNASLVSPYEGAKDMLLVEDPENRDFLTELLRVVAKDLPASKH